jgi:ankyrin repeat protein
VQLLVGCVPQAAGARDTYIDATTLQGHTALHLSALKGHRSVSRALVSAGADIYVRANDGASCLTAVRAEPRPVSADAAASTAERSVADFCIELEKTHRWVRRRELVLLREALLHTSETRRQQPSQQKCAPHPGQELLLSVFSSLTREIGAYL